MKPLLLVTQLKTGELTIYVKLIFFVTNMQRFCSIFHPGLSSHIPETQGRSTKFFEIFGYFSKQSTVFKGPLLVQGPGKTPFTPKFDALLILEGSPAASDTW